MRTTLKRGIGRATAVNGNGRAVLPPTILTTVNRYEQPVVRRTTGRRLLRGFVWLLVVLSSLALASAAGAYLYYHESVGNIAAHSKDVKRAAKALDIPLPNQPAIALVVGYDARKGPQGFGASDSRSDTVMLLRADPTTNAISMLSFPRDLTTTIWCGDKIEGNDRINSAFTRCGSLGTLSTVKHLTGLPINYLITVNFHGFKQVVDRVGGVWIDVDRRYFNRNDPNNPATNYANIDLQPGYQRLNGSQALDYVRYRHTDSDLFRVARQQAFVKALKQQVSANFSVFTALKVVGAITHNVEIGGPDLESAVKQYALFAYKLPAGHFFQAKVDNLQGYAELTASSQDISKAVESFSNPDVEAPQKATAVTFGRKAAGLKAPPASQVSINVLNGNGVLGSATNAGYELAQHGYKLIVPSDPASRNAPTFDYFRTKVYYDKTQPGAKQAAEQIANLFGDADVAPIPAEIVGLSQSAMITVVVGSTFHGKIAPAPVDQTPKKEPPAVRKDPAASEPLLRTAKKKKVPFRLMLPTVLEQSSSPDYEVPLRVYPLKKGEPAVRLTYLDRAALAGYWGIEETRWNDAPVLQKPNFQHKLEGRTYAFYYNGSHLHMVVLKWRGSSYWVVNTLTDSLSNETMIAIAKGLQPLR